MYYLVLISIITLLLVKQYETNDDIISHLTREKCIDELGCFSAGPPFFDIVERAISLLPDDRESINTHFLLYTPENPNVSKNFSNIRKDVSNILHSTYNPRVSTIFVVPGYISGISPTWKKLIVESLLMDSGSNVFLVDWTGGDGLLYEQAVANTRVVGAEIALFIKKLQSIVGLQTETVHIIGHSLGSHIAGYAGKRLKNLGRITALDPAGPYFTNVDPVVRLNRNDALLVDAIHTNAAPSRFTGFGLTESIGHFDFFPNGGHLQPGCKDMGQAIWSFLLHPSFDAEGLRDFQCNHVRAIYLFISSIQNTKCELWGTLCNSWDDYVSGKCSHCKNGGDEDCVPLGLLVDHYASMIKKDRSLNVFLNTTATEPFCL